MPTGEYPRPEAFANTFLVYEVEVTEEAVRYYGEPLTGTDRVLERVAPLFRDRGYRVTLDRQTGEHVLIAKERSLSIDGIPWVNVGLFLATVATTLFAGSQWYGLPIADQPWRVLEAWPFALAVVGVFAVHEFGHYALSRYHDVQATLPYFIPFPNGLGTFGAVIRMKDTLPSRTALFDIGVSGPLAGLVATVVVTAIGVSLPPIEVGADSLASQIQLGYPPLIQGVAALLGERLTYADPTLLAHPVVIGGWVGAFVTFLNLLPVGQLDGAHVTRALVGEWFASIQSLVPLALFGLAIGQWLFGDGRAVTLWIVWGFLALVFSRVGAVDPIDDSPVGPRRKVLGLVTLVLGLLCFTPAPIVVGV